MLLNNDNFLDVLQFKSNQVSIIDKKNIGLSIALNQGIKLAKKLIFFSGLLPWVDKKNGETRRIGGFGLNK